MPSPKPTHDEIVQAHINDLKATINGLENKIRRMTNIIISGDERQKQLENQLKEMEVTK
jgi:uncharacterized protein YlxW (UPF0749 family)